jgi:hypothetical protein
MITNLIATILITITTNTFAPKQYWHEPNTMLLSNPPQMAPGYWDDSAPYIYSPNPWGRQPQERDNPDIRITEVRQIRTFSFEFEGKTYSHELSNVVLSTRKERKVITASEPTFTNGMKVVTTVERWEVEK